MPTETQIKSTLERYAIPPQFKESKVEVYEAFDGLHGNVIYRNGSGTAGRVDFIFTDDEWVCTAVIMDPAYWNQGTYAYLTNAVHEIGSALGYDKIRIYAPSTAGDLALMHRKAGFNKLDEEHMVAELGKGSELQKYGQWKLGKGSEPARHKKYAKKEEE